MTSSNRSCSEQNDLPSFVSRVDGAAVDDSSGYHV